MELPAILLGKHGNCSACKRVVLVTKTNCPEQILLNRSDTKSRIAELEASLIEALLAEDSPAKSVTPIDRIWEKQHQLNDRMETTQSILDRLETVLPEVEDRQTEHSTASKQLKRANADIELLEKELGQTAMQGVLAGNIARNELFEERIALHQRLVALESEKSEIGESTNADWKDQLKSKSQYVKVTAQIKVETLKVGGLDTTIGRTLLTDGIEETVRCSETSAVLDRVSIKRTEQQEAVETESATRISFSDMLQTAATIAEVSSFGNAASVQPEITKLKRQLKDIQKLLAKNQSDMLEAAITTTAIRQISIVGPLVTELASLQDRLVETKPKLKNLVIKPIASWQRIPRGIKNLLYGALTVALVAAIWGWAIPQDVKDQLAITFKTEFKDNTNPKQTVPNPSSPINPTTGQEPSESELETEQFEMESESPEDPGPDTEAPEEDFEDSGPEPPAEEDAFPSTPRPDPLADNNLVIDIIVLNCAQSYDDVKMEFELINRSKVLLSYVAVNGKFMGLDGTYLGTDLDNDTNVPSGKSVIMTFNLKNVQIDEIGSWELSFGAVNIDLGDGKSREESNHFKLNEILGSVQHAKKNEVVLENELAGHWKNGTGISVFLAPRVGQYTISNGGQVQKFWVIKRDYARRRIVARRQFEKRLDTGGGEYMSGIEMTYVLDDASSIGVLTSGYLGSKTGDRWRQVEPHGLVTKTRMQDPGLDTSEMPSDPGSDAEAPEEDIRASIMLVIEPITNTIGMKLKLIPVSTFLMGSLEDETDRDDNEHQHNVTVSKVFFIQTTEVTQGQWKAVMGTEPWKGKSYVKEGPNYPATYISWDDAVAFCKKLSSNEGKTYRLPTEAEWEYACRAGTKTAWSFGNDEKELGDYAWYKENTADIGEQYAHQVRLKKPNAFGLYDMHGNVWEWCHDYYGEDYYKQSPAKDSTGPTQGSLRVFRGGSWDFRTGYTRSAKRGSNVADNRGDDVGRLGFRLVRELEVEDLTPRPPQAIAPSTIDVRKLYLKKHINEDVVVGFRLTNTSNLLLSHVSMDIKCFDINDRVLGSDGATIRNIRPNNKAVLEFTLEDTKVQEIAYWDLVIRDVLIDQGDGKEISATSRYKINMVGITEKKITDEIRLERRLSGRWKSKEGDEFIFSTSADECKATSKNGVLQVFRTEVMARWYYSPEGESDKRGVDVRLHHVETGIGMQWRLVYVTKDNIAGFITHVGKDGVWKEVDTTSGEKALSQWTRQENQDDLDELKKRFAGHWSAKIGEFYFSPTGDKCSVVAPNGVTEVFQTEIMSRRQLKNDFDLLLVRFHKNESRDGFEMSFLFGQKSEKGNYLGFASTLTGLKMAGNWKAINDEGQKQSLQLFTFVDKKTEPK